MDARSSARREKCESRWVTEQANGRVGNSGVARSQSLEGGLRNEVMRRFQKALLE